MGDPAKKINDEKKPVETTAKMKVVEDSKKELPVKVLSISEKVSKVEKLKILIDKRELLIGKMDKLEKFALSSDGQTDHLILKDANGAIFQTSNRDVVTAVIELIKGHLGKAIGDVESKIDL